MLYPVFKVISTEHSLNTITAALEVDADSELFSGHFPEQPVVPGACMLQTVKEILEDTFKAQLSLVKADNIKFLNRVVPGIGHLNLQINYQVVDNQFKVAVNLTADDTVCMKLKGTFLAK